MPSYRNGHVPKDGYVAGLAEHDRQERIAMRREIAALKAQLAALETLVPLVRHVMDGHADVDDGHYYECDIEPCDWCSEARVRLAVWEVLA